MFVKQFKAWYMKNYRVNSREEAYQLIKGNCGKKTQLLLQQLLKEDDLISNINEAIDKLFLSKQYDYKYIVNTQDYVVYINKSYQDFVNIGDTLNIEFIEVDNKKGEGRLIIGRHKFDQIKKQVACFLNKKNPTSDLVISGQMWSCRVDHVKDNCMIVSAMELTKLNIEKLKEKFEG